MSDQPTSGGAGPYEPTVFGEQPPAADPNATVAVPAAGPDPTPPEGVAVPPGGGTPPPGGPGGGGPGGPGGPWDDEEPEEPWYRKPAVLTFGGLAIGLLIFLAFVLIAGGGDDEGDDTTTTVSTTTTAPTTTTSSTTTSTTTTTTTAPTTTTTTTTTTAPPALVPGQPCTPGSSPDCIDPEGDGSYVYLIDGGDCISVRPDPATCADLDGDGIAGYPDAG
jgi:hypothetical protein